VAATEILVLSPHLDDGVLSLGAFIARAAAAGTKVTVATIFGGDPHSTAPAGRWDSRAGFETAGGATRARRREDEAACALVGAWCEWLPFLDKDYGPPPDPDVVWEQLAEGVRRADFVFAPGRPLFHGDHAWVSRLVAERADQGKLVFYAELPYDAWPEERRSANQEVASRGQARAWTVPRTGLRARLLKWRATAAYSSQLPWLARPGYRTAVLATRLGRERLAWPNA
jgi:LmbE family N-acetylglucosaminyl deacetylase